MESVFLLGIAGGFLGAVVFTVLVDGAHMQAERGRRIAIARKRHSRA